MGPLLVLVSPCFRENVVITCKIGSFLCSLDTLLKKKKKKKLIVFYLEINLQNDAHLKKGLFLAGLLFIFFSHQGNVAKFLQHTYLTHIHVFCSP